MTIIVIHGPPRSGKTTNAKALARFYGVGNIFDNDQDRGNDQLPFPRNWSLILTNRSPDDIRRWQEAHAKPHPILRFIPIDKALAEAGITPPKAAGKEYRLSLFDHTALTYLMPGYSTATHHIARAVGFDRCNGHNATAKARNLLKRLERWGMVEGIRASRSGNVYWWKITGAGRKAVAA